MKKIIYFILLLYGNSISAQNKQVLYDFAELPQTLLLNPAAETNYKFHVGVPVLSGFSANIGSSDIVLSDLFSPDNLNINDKTSNVISGLTSREFLNFNTQVEVFSGGYRLNDDSYLSFGFYQELDGIGYLPKDGLTLLSEGNNAFINKSFSASQINYKLDVIGVLHFGINKKIDEKLTLGRRFKLYSSALNVESKNNTGTFTTVNGGNNIYTHYLKDMNIDFRTSGLIEDDEYIDDASNYLKNTFFGENLGVGVDFGITYKLNSQLEFSGSILDVGFINHKSTIKNTKVKGDFTFDGVNFLFDANNPVDYWATIDGELKNKIPTTEDEESYISWRPTKLNAALKYSFGERRSKICYDNRFKDFYTDAIGLQFYSVFRPLSPQLAITGFYEKAFIDKIHTKITYTIDDFSYSNIGVGASVQFWKVNIYGMVDNVLAYRNLASANSLSLQLGINLIFN
jgi:hypothetical protein